MANVPDVGNVTVVVPVAVNVVLNAPEVAKVEPSAIVNVEPVAGAVIVTLLIDVALATPNVGVVKLGDVANTTEPDPVVVAADIAVPLPDNIPVIVVDKVNAGVAPPLDEPANPLADTTDTAVTVPVVGVDHCGAVAPEFTVNTCPAVPIPNLVAEGPAPS